MIRTLTAASLLLALACQAPAPVPAPVPSPQPIESFVPQLSIRPLGVALNRGATQAFQAEINYPEGSAPLKQPVAWLVQEPGGGTITAEGLYTAPAKPGTYHVLVNREDFPGLTATATVWVK